MVVYVPDKTGRFSHRPHFKPGELDRECENIITSFLKTRHGAAAFPVSTDDLTVLIERDTESLDLYADLAEYGSDVEGLTQFQPGRKPIVKIEQRLAADERYSNRLRTTLAHEYGHVKFHAYLWDMEPPEPDLLRRDPKASMQVCYRDKMLERRTDRLDGMAGGLRVRRLVNAGESRAATRWPLSRILPPVRRRR